MAAVAVLVIAVLVPMLRQRGDSAPAASNPGPIPSATATTTPTTPPTSPAAAPPAGYRLYRDPSGWSVGVPTAWPATREAGTVTFRDGDRVLSVTEHANPPADPYVARLRQEKAGGATIPGYDFLRVARVPYRSWRTADWEYRAGAEPVMHTVVRTTVPTRNQAFDIALTTEDRHWTADHAVFDTATQTFDPGD